MTDDQKPTDANGQGGVFGNLPGSRPGTRSPRERREPQRAAGQGEGTAARGRQPSRSGAESEGEGQAEARIQGNEAAPAEAAARSAAERRPAAGERDAETATGGGLEEIAWAGVAAAAEAATLGVRLANRAIEALRGKPERD